MATRNCHFIGKVLIGACLAFAEEIGLIHRAGSTYIAMTVVEVIRCPGVGAVGNRDDRFTEQT